MMVNKNVYIVLFHTHKVSLATPTDCVQSHPLPGLTNFYESFLRPCSSKLCESEYTPLEFVRQYNMQIVAEDILNVTKKLIPRKQLLNPNCRHL